MASLSSPSSASDAKYKAATVHLNSRLQSCWDLDFNWELYPCKIKMVSDTTNDFYSETCHKDHLYSEITFL